MVGMVCSLPQRPTTLQYMLPTSQPYCLLSHGWADSNVKASVEMGVPHQPRQPKPPQCLSSLCLSLGDKGCHLPGGRCLTTVLHWEVVPQGYMAQVLREKLWEAIETVHDLQGWWRSPVHRGSVTGVCQGEDRSHSRQKCDLICSWFSQKSKVLLPSFIYLLYSLHRFLFKYH